MKLKTQAEESDFVKEKLARHELELAETWKKSFGQQAKINVTHLRLARSKLHKSRAKRSIKQDHLREEKKRLSKEADEVQLS